MQVIIIEDEKPAALRLQQYIQQYDVNTGVTVIIESVQQGVDWFNQNKQPDLIFSDIELLDNNVFELFKKVSIECPVIFITSYDRFALQAFEVNSISYLLKPFQYADVANALNKFEQIKRSFSSHILKLLPQEFVKKTYKQRFVTKVKGGVALLEISGIAYLQVKNGVTFAFNAENNSFIINENLNTLEKIIDPEVFFRINRSEMVNINFIERIYSSSKESLTIQLKFMKVSFQTSSTRTPEFRKWINR